MSDFDGRTGIFKQAKPTDRFMFTYPGYKDKNIELSQIYNNQEDSDVNTFNIELEPYVTGEIEELKIHIGGMGIDDKGKVTVTNTNTNESYTMSQKYNENYKNILVSIGDELVFTRRGFRPIHVIFRTFIPNRIDIAPLKGKDSDAQYLEF